MTEQAERKLFITKLKIAVKSELRNTSSQCQPSCFPRRFLSKDITNIKQTIPNPKAATPPTAMATVLSVCCFVPTPIHHKPPNIKT